MHVSQAAPSQTVYKKTNTYKEGAIYEATFRAMHSNGEIRIYSYRGAAGSSKETMLKTIEVFRQMAIQSTPERMGELFDARGTMRLKLANTEQNKNLFYLLVFNYKAGAEAQLEDRWRVMSAQNPTGVQAPVAVHYSKMNYYFTWDENLFHIKKDQSYFGRLARSLAPTIGGMAGKLLPFDQYSKWIENEGKNVDKQVNAKNAKQTYEAGKARLAGGQLEVEIEPIAPGDNNDGEDS